MEIGLKGIFAWQDPRNEEGVKVVFCISFSGKHKIVSHVKWKSRETEIFPGCRHKCRSAYWGGSGRPKGKILPLSISNTHTHTPPNRKPEPTPGT